MKYNKRDFEKYRKTIVKLMEKFGLNGWECTFSFQPIDNNTFAEVSFHSEQHKASFTMSSGDVPDYPMSSPVECALHEVLHLLLANLSDMARERQYSEERYASEEHAVINTLMRAFREMKLF